MGHTYACGIDYALNQPGPSSGAALCTPEWSYFLLFGMLALIS